MLNKATIDIMKEISQRTNRVNPRYSRVAGRSGSEQNTEAYETEAGVAGVEEQCAKLISNEIPSIARSSEPKL